MAEQNALSFTPEMSKRSLAIESLTNQQIFNRYIIKSLSNSSFGDDFDDELNAKNENNDYKYRSIVSLLGDNVDYLRTVLDIKVSPVLPEGYKLNMPNIFADVEMILEDNRSKVKEAIENQVRVNLEKQKNPNQKINAVTPFVRQMVNYLSQKMLHSYILKDDNTFTIENNIDL